MNSLDKVKKFMSRIDESYGIINESAESDKLENVRDINIERARRFLLEMLKNGSFNFGRLVRLSGNPHDYAYAPGGMKAGFDDDGHPFPQWPDCNPGDWAVSSPFTNIPTPLYSQKYRIPSEVNYKSWEGARELPNGKYELNGVGHDRWIQTYTPFMNAIMNNFPVSEGPKINGVNTHATLGFVLWCVMKNPRYIMLPEAVFKFNKLVKYMIEKGYFNEGIERTKALVSRKQKNMIDSDEEERIIGSTGNIIGNNGEVIVPAELDVRNLRGDDIKNVLGVDESVASRFARVEGEFAEDLARRKETSLNKYRDISLESGKVKHTNSGYTILRIDNFNEAEKYSQYCTWCICTSVTSFDQYGMADGQVGGIPAGGRIYFCLRDDFKNVERPTDENGNTIMDGDPLDDYGLSMICVTVWADDGACNTITSRWNHVNGGSDNVMTPDELEDVLGVSFYAAFPGAE